MSSRTPQKFVNSLFRRLRQYNILSLLIRLADKFLFTHSFNVNKKRDCSVRMYNPQLSNLLLF